MKTIKFFLISIFVFFSISLSAQLTLDSYGRVGIQTSTINSNLQLGSNTTYNSRVASIGSELRLGNYSSSWNTAFIQARNNTTQTFGITFRSQQNGSVKNSFRVESNGYVTFYEGHGPSSDIRLKKNVIKMDKSEPDKLYNLDAIRFQYDFSDTTEIEEKAHIGLSAQKVKEFFPEAVFTGDDGYYRIDYNELIPVIIEALKKQNMIIKEQKNIIDSIVSSNNIKLKNGSLLEKRNNEPVSSVNKLFQNSPNPFSETTEINFFISKEALNSMICIYDMNGTQLKCITIQSTGNGSISVYGNELKAGMYMYTLIADGKAIDTKRMILTNK